MHFPPTNYLFTLTPLSVENITFSFPPGPGTQSPCSLTFPPPRIPFISIGGASTQSRVSSFPHPSAVAGTSSVATNPLQASHFPLLCLLQHLLRSTPRSVAVIHHPLPQTLPTTRLRGSSLAFKTFHGTHPAWPPVRTIHLFLYSFTCLHTKHCANHYVHSFL